MIFKESLGAHSKKQKELMAKFCPHDPRITPCVLNLRLVELWKSGGSVPRPIGSPHLTPVIME